MISKARKKFHNFVNKAKNVKLSFELGAVPLLQDANYCNDIYV